MHTAERYGHGYTTILSPGNQAPDFCLASAPDQKLCLKDLLGKPLVLVFYPADWSPQCEDLDVCENILQQLQECDSALVAISLDAPWSHLAFSNERKLHFPLLADFQPKGEVARKYGIYDENNGVCDRAIFVIDQEGVISWSYLAPEGIKIKADAILNAVDALNRRD
ncbi:redoxin domain-containing protein [Bdellovibrio reynosensis]|uniref:Redoxin domain-containing protein n=1 Tax=Bdellovibrio reynosensis TaxID=2835041 RepID=A0ABY4C886_9BACT|nr:redoxin domain-containing protein [Bdellovibrio reynosensis]UOF00122.1 redoxin domain-containing protein [Bdellovibrio reynosensis]